LPEGVDGEFIHRMEDVLELDAEPRDPARPVVGFDEASKELRGDVAEPVPAAPRSPAKRDSESTRNGTADPFVIVEPLAGRRHVTVTDRRTIPDFAAQMKYLGDELYPEAATIRVVLDDLNARDRVAVRRLPARGGVAAEAASGVPPDAEACRLAEHGGDGAVGALAAVPGSPPTREGPAGGRGGGMAGGAEPGRGAAGVELSRRRRTQEARTSLPARSSAVDH
jgi:hypothetical protein